MMALGQAAGVAAALCCSLDTTPRALDVREVQKALEAIGVDLRRGRAQGTARLFYRGAR